MTAWCTTYDFPIDARDVVSGRYVSPAPDAREDWILDRIDVLREAHPDAAAADLRNAAERQWSALS